MSFSDKRYGKQLFTHHGIEIKTDWTINAIWVNASLNVDITGKSLTDV